MNRIWISFLILWTALATSAQINTADSWKQLKELERLGRPQSALQLLDSMVLEFQESNDYPNLIKGYYYRIQLFNQYQQNPQKEYLAYLEEIYPKAPFPVKEMLAIPLAKALLNVELESGAGTPEPIERVLQMVEGTLSNQQLLTLSTEDFMPAFQAPTFDIKEYEKYWEVDTSYNTNGTRLQPTLMDVLLKETVSLFNHPLLNEISLDKKFFQTLEQFHQNNQDTAAWLHTILEYQQRNLPALLTLFEDFPRPEVLLPIGTFYWNNNDTPKAKLIFKQLVHNYSGTYEAAVAKRNLDNIDKPTFTAQIPEVIATNKSIPLSFSSKNIDGLYYNLYPVTITNWLALKRKTPQQVLSGLPIRNLKLKPVPQDSLLPNPGKGAFILLLSNHSNPLNKDQASDIKMLFFQVSDLAFYQTSHRYNKNIMVAHADLGYPIEGTKVEFFENTNYRIDGFNKEYPTTILTTDANGMARIPEDLSMRTVFRLIHLTDTLYNDALFLNNTSISKIPDTVSKSYLITDKAIYKPGTPLHFKVIHYQSIRTVPNQSLTDKALTISLLNSRGEVLTTQEITTNKFGTATGSFNIPADELSGYWTLRVDEDQSVRRFYVEEYSLPEAIVELNIENESPKAGDTLIISGHLKAFSGRNPKGARVLLSLKPLETIYRRGGIPSGKSSHVEWQTTVFSDESGQFKVSIPTELKSGKYQVKAEALTQSGAQCETTLNFTLGKQKWRTGIKIPNLVVDGQWFDAELSVTNFMNEQRAAPFHFTIRSSKTNQIIFQEFGILNGNLKIPIQLNEADPGSITAELLVYENNGNSISQQEESIIIDQNFIYRDSNKGFLYHVTKGTYKAGDTIELRLASDIPIFTIWEFSDGTISSSWVKADQFKYTQIVKKGQVNLHLIGVRNHEFFYYQESFQVETPERDLILLYDQFTTTLTPGQKVKWHFSLNNPEGKAALSEVASVLYNKALDERAVQNWEFPSKSLLRYPSFSVREGLFHKADIIPFQFRPKKPVFYPPIWKPELDIHLNNFGIMSPLAMRSNKMGMMEEKTAAPEAVSDSVEPIDQVSDDPPLIRKDAEEIVFFLPSIESNKKGMFSIEFDAPTTLSEWKLKLLALDQNFNGVVEEKTITTFKPFFLDPNVPRFLRQGDVLIWKTPLANLSDSSIKGKANLFLVNLDTQQEITTKFVNKPELDFEVKTHSESYLNWTLNLENSNTDTIDFIMSASSENFEDRLRSTIPIISNRVELSENLPLFLPPSASDTLSFDWKTTPEITWVTNPLEWIWAVIPTFFKEDQPSNTITFINQRLAAVWAIKMEKSEYGAKLAIIDAWLTTIQNEDGGFSWFPEGRSNGYITFYVLDLASRMKDYPLPKELIKKALRYLENSRLPEIYKAYINANWNIKKEYANLPEEDWSALPPLLKIMMGRYYHLIGEGDKASAIVQSLKETALGDSDTGIFWARDSWGGALQITADALLFFIEIDAGPEWIQGLQMEILKHKRVNGWGNSKASALAIGALWSTFTEKTKIPIKEIVYQLTQKGNQGYLIVNNPNQVPAWGGILQSYSNSIEKVEAFSEGPLKINREYFYMDKDSWSPIADLDSFKLGQTIKVTLNISAETPMQTIVIKDQIPATAEIPFVPSKYRWDQNIYYYQTRNQDAMLFYFDELPRGTHQLSYTFKLGRKGAYNSGLSTITSAYDDTFGGFDENYRWKIH